MELFRINASAFPKISTVIAVPITLAFKPVGAALLVLADSRTVGTPVQFVCITTEVNAMQKTMMNKHDWEATLHDQKRILQAMRP